MTSLVPFPWRVIHRETYVAPQGLTVVNRFTLPTVNIFATFRAQLTAYAGGTCNVRLRWGFDDADADAGVIGIDFAALAGPVGFSDLQSQQWAVGGAAPGAIGNALSILPPRVSVIVQTIGPGVDLAIDVSFACLGVEP